MLLYFTFSRLSSLQILSDKTIVSCDRGGELIIDGSLKAHNQTLRTVKLPLSEAKVVHNFTYNKQSALAIVE